MKVKGKVLPGTLTPCPATSLYSPQCHEIVYCVVFTTARTGGKLTCINPLVSGMGTEVFPAVVEVHNVEISDYDQY